MSRQKSAVLCGCGWAMGELGHLGVGCARSCDDGACVGVVVRLGDCVQVVARGESRGQGPGLHCQLGDGQPGGGGRALPIERKGVLVKTGFWLAHRVSALARARAVVWRVGEWHCHLDVDQILSGPEVGMPYIRCPDREDDAVAVEWDLVGNAATVGHARRMQNTECQTTPNAVSISRAADPSRWGGSPGLIPWARCTAC